jgi:hypothetical protein
MATAELVPETSVYMPFSHLTRLIAREYFIEFSYRGNFKLGRIPFIHNSGNLKTPTNLTAELLQL